MNSVKIYLFS